MTGYGHFQENVKTSRLDFLSAGFLFGESLICLKGKFKKCDLEGVIILTKM